MEHEVKDEDAAICLGNARSGKSTLINLLIGNKLIAKKIGRVGRINLITLNNGTKGPEIVAGTVSATSIPAKWKSSKLSNLSIWDTPGFGDNRGEIQDITNSYYIFQLLKHVQSLKFIVVITFDDIIDEYSEPFTSVLFSIEKMFGTNFEDLFPSITIVITKAPNTYYDNPVNVDFIKNVLEESYFPAPDVTFSNILKKFLRYVLSNNQIAFFRKPNRVGEFIYNESDNIFQAIRKSRSVNRSNIQDIHLIASSNTKNCLYEIRDSLLSSKNVSKFEKAVLEVYSKKLEEFNASIYNNSYTFEGEKLQIIVTKYLNQIDNVLSSKMEFFKMVDIIKEIDNRLINIVKRCNLLEKIQLMGFYDMILKTKLNDQYQSSFVMVLTVFQTKFQMILKIIDYKMLKITKEELDDFLITQKAEFEIKYRLLLDIIEYSENKNRYYGFYKILSAILTTCFGLRIKF